VAEVPHAEGTDPSLVQPRAWDVEHRRQPQVLAGVAAPKSRSACYQYFNTSIYSRFLSRNHYEYVYTDCGDPPFG
jgi:hypothetical protein